MFDTDRRFSICFVETFMPYRNHCPLEILFLTRPTPRVLCDPWDEPCFPRQTVRLLTPRGCATDPHIYRRRDQFHSPPRCRMEAPDAPAEVDRGAPPISRFGEEGSHHHHHHRREASRRMPDAVPDEDGDEDDDQVLDALFGPNGSQLPTTGFAAGCKKRRTYHPFHPPPAADQATKKLRLDTLNCCTAPADSTPSALDTVDVADSEPEEEEEHFSDARSQPSRSSSGETIQRLHDTLSSMHKALANSNIKIERMLDSNRDAATTSGNITPPPAARKPPTPDLSPESTLAIPSSEDEELAEDDYGSSRRPSSPGPSGGRPDDAATLAIEHGRLKDWFKNLGVQPRRATEVDVPQHPRQRQGRLRRDQPMPSTSGRWLSTAGRSQPPAEEEQDVRLSRFGPRPTSHGEPEASPERDQRFPFSSRLGARASGRGEAEVGTTAARRHPVSGVVPRRASPRKLVLRWRLSSSEGSDEDAGGAERPRETKNGYISAKGEGRFRAAAAAGACRGTRPVVTPDRRGSGPASPDEELQSFWESLSRQHRRQEDQDESGPWPQLATSGGRRNVQEPVTSAGRIIAESRRSAGGRGGHVTDPTPEDSESPMPWQRGVEMKVRRANRPAAEPPRVSFALDVAVSPVRGFGERGFTTDAGSRAGRLARLRLQLAESDDSDDEEFDLQQRAVAPPRGDGRLHRRGSPPYGAASLRRKVSPAASTSALPVGASRRGTAVPRRTWSSGIVGQGTVPLRYETQAEEAESLGAFPGYTLYPHPPTPPRCPSGKKPGKRGNVTSRSRSTLGSPVPVVRRRDVRSLLMSSDEGSDSDYDDVPIYVSHPVAKSPLPPAVTAPSSSHRDGILRRGSSRRSRSATAPPTTRWHQAAPSSSSTTSQSRQPAPSAPPPDEPEEWNTDDNAGRSAYCPGWTLDDLEDSDNEDQFASAAVSRDVQDAPAPVASARSVASSTSSAVAGASAPAVTTTRPATRPHWSTLVDLTSYSDDDDPEVPPPRGLAEARSDLLLATTQPTSNPTGDHFRPDSPDPVLRVQQMEADEALARQLQAQFDTELPRRPVVRRPSVYPIRRPPHPDDPTTIVYPITPLTADWQPARPGVIQPSPANSAYARQMAAAAAVRRSVGPRRRPETGTDPSGSFLRMFWDLDHLNFDVGQGDVETEDVLEPVRPRVGAVRPWQQPASRVPAPARDPQRTARQNAVGLAVYRHLQQARYSSDSDADGGAAGLALGEDDALPPGTRGRRTGQGGGPGVRRRSPRGLRNRIGVERIPGRRTTNRSYEELLAFVDTLSPPPRGLSRARITTLPIRQYVADRRSGSPVAGPSSRQSGSGASGSGSRLIDDDLPECSICMSEYETGHYLRTLPCSHEFHSDCIDKWLKEKNTCPVCRFQI